MNPSAVKISRAGTSTSQSRPPTRPVVGLRGACSHRASFGTGQRNEPRSRWTSSSTNCQIRPTVMSTRRARGKAKGPSSRSATKGATIQASAAIGSAAAAQMPKIFAREYCSLRPPAPGTLCAYALIFSFSQRRFPVESDCGPRGDPAHHSNVTEALTGVDLKPTLLRQVRRVLWGLSFCIISNTLV